MKNLILLTLLTLCFFTANAQTGLSCADAIPLTNLNNSCSDSAQYNNSNPAQKGVTWFKFVADSSCVYITVNGKDAGGSLPLPQVNMVYSCAGVLVQNGKVTINGNVTTYYTSGLGIGTTYYIAVSGASGNIGSFKICVNNVSPVINASSLRRSLFLCDTSVYYENLPLYFNYSEDFNDEAEKYTCVDNGSDGGGDYVWFKWKAANSGTLVFTITSIYTFVSHNFLLYDLGADGTIAANVASVIRCDSYDAHHCYGTQKAPMGLDFDETDVSESSSFDCPPGPNGFLKNITMIAGHIYALLVESYENDITGKNLHAVDFTLAFHDMHGRTGTGLFTPLTVPINYTGISGTPCTADHIYTFTDTLHSYHRFQWDFGAGATIINADANNNYTVKYSTGGVKNIKVYAISDSGCVAERDTSITITEPVVLATPAITTGKPLYCIGDTILLSTPQVNGLTYRWSGPDNFTATGPNAAVIIKDNTMAGSYLLKVYDGACVGATAAVSIGSFLNRPVAAFTTTPSLPSTQQNPASVQFTNQSANADSYLWDFGDGSTSAAVNPTHQYTVNGSYNITLTAYQSTACSNSVSKGTLTVKNISSTLIPNTFTPNGDGTNDLWDIVMVNVNASHLQVFNRYGQQVFETYNNARNWNGSYNGKPLPVGVYYYILGITGTDGTASKLSGSVTIIR